MEFAHSYSVSAAPVMNNMSTLDADESVIDAQLRRHDDEEASAILDEDDLESVTSTQAGGTLKKEGKAEEEKELPPYACA